MAQNKEMEIPEEGRVVEDPYQVISRRKFISWLGLGWAAFGAATATAGAAFQRFLFPNVLREPPQVFKIGMLQDFQEGIVDERFKDRYGIWVVRGFDPIVGKNGIYVLSTICTHLGCTPTWLAGEQKFKCPCHGSGYYQSGINFEGPTPRPLERFRVVLADDGQILVDKTRKFQYELGQWSDNEAFLKSG